MLLAANQVWSGLVPALLAVTAGVLLTGAFHEDGLADSADSLGGQTPERRLAIMQDSRIGSYGTLALIASSPCASRRSPPCRLARRRRADRRACGRTLRRRDADQHRALCGRRVGKIVQSDDPLRRHEVARLHVRAPRLCALLAMAWPAGVTAALAGIVVAVMAARLAMRLLGGYTGDVAGAIEQLFEVAVLLAVAAWGR